MMIGVQKNLVPQADKLERVNSATNSDRVEAPMVGAGPTDFGGGQMYDSASQATGVEQQQDEQKGQHQKDIEAMEAEILVQTAAMKKLIGDMKGAIKKQPNVNSTIKNGIPKLEEMVDLLSHTSKKCTEARKRAAKEAVEERRLKVRTRRKDNSPTASNLKRGTSKTSRRSPQKRPDETPSSQPAESTRKETQVQQPIEELPKELGKTSAQAREWKSATHRRKKKETKVMDKEAVPVKMPQKKKEGRRKTKIEEKKTEEDEAGSISAQTFGG